MSATNSHTDSERPPVRKRRRLIVLCVVGLLLCGLALGYRHFWYSHPMGTGPAGPRVDRNAFATTWTEQPVLLVGLGDSMTAGFGSSPGHSYFKRLLKNPSNEFADMQGICLSKVIPNIEARNHSLSGSTSLECLDVLLPKLEVQDEKTIGVVVLTTGGNDIIHNYGRTPPREHAMYGATVKQARPWIDNFRDRLQTILDAIDSRFPAGCHIFLANIYDPTDDVGDAHHAGLPSWTDGLAVIGEYNGVIEDVITQRDNVHLIDMHGAFLGHGIHCVKFWAKHYDAGDPHYWYYDNLEDPNDRGYDALRRLFLLKMAEVLPDAFGRVEK